MKNYIKISMILSLLTLTIPMLSMEKTKLIESQNERENAKKTVLIKAIQDLKTGDDTNINNRDLEDGFTALHTLIWYHSADNNMTKKIEELLQEKANSSIQDNDGFTPLDLAIYLHDNKKDHISYLKIIRKLLFYGANPNSIDLEGDTALLSATKKHDNKNNDLTDVIILLLLYNADPYAKDALGRNSYDITEKKKFGSEGLSFDKLVTQILSQFE